ncbi:hypothetical protein [Lacibacter sp.]|uniref:hypothetical protein n=1 Tax=Lacibacter sp. TaxID=1915409 RepID=UPI002B4B008E|nr:hypothetical protein [Lacibacter sp.]HLP39685.1 hypothetical protein [Lacibacter sp.]
MMTKLETEYDLVFIVDCLSQQDRDDFKISEDLMNFLASKGIKQLQGKCKNKAMVLDTFTYMKKLADTGLKFCLQIVSHGTEEGLWIEETDEDIYWEELRNLLYELNSKLENTLIVNMTSCRGLNGVKIIDENKGDYPFFGLIGCNRDLYIDEAKTTNDLFYSKLLEGKDISTIIPEIQQEFKSLGKTDDVIYGISSQGYKAIVKKLSKR